MQGSVGWTCPKCGAIISPYDQTCKACTAKPTIGVYTGWSGTITLGGAGTLGTFYAAPAKTDAQKLDEALARAVRAERKAEKYSKWADKIIEFYEQLNDLTQELDNLTNEPDRIEGNE